MEDGTFNRMNGHVEADETFIGGKARNMHKAKRAVRIAGTGGTDKVPVMGLLQREGPGGHSVVRAQVVKNTRRSSLGPMIRVNVETGATLYSDGKASYNGLEDAYLHEAVNHDAAEYVRDGVHTNGIENFWSLLKRSLHGTYISVEPFHLFCYIDEQVFRFNSRGLKDGQRFKVAATAIIGKRLTWEHLTQSGAGSPA
jgi:transposase-like protein